MVAERPGTGRGLARARGATSMVAWLRGSHRVGPGEASRLMRTARALREQLPATAQAMAAGGVHFSQAEVIADSLKDLSTEVSPAQRAEGEATLISACDSLDPVGLGRLGRRLEELLDPDGVQARDEAKICDHEAKAFGKRELTFSPDPYGSAGTIRGRYDPAGYAVLTAALEALSAPLTETPDGEKDTRSPGARRYDAFVEIARRGLHHPATGSGDGGKAQIRVTIPLASLTGRTGYGVLDDGTQISPTLARMLACDAAIIPAVLDGAGQPIDLGRERRLYAGPARTAIEIRDGGCVWPGCSRPTSWCQIHHLIPWSQGGRTDQVNGGLFCWHHHRDIEQGEWEAFHHRGRIWLRPPERLDPHRWPRINHTHRPPPPTTDWPPGAYGASLSRDRATTARHHGPHDVNGCRFTDRRFPGGLLL
ncbi:MAG: HNH endonuclease [Actinomycetota bacterium]|nr:HNH endonuclease [Actinomycetota bacterium]